eukprot:scaffold4511_cov171-Amphora_coffeaeformis.AAC.24
MPKGIINGKGQRISFDKSNKKSKGEKGNQIPQSKTGKESNETLLKGQGGTIIAEFFGPTGIWFFFDTTFTVITRVALKGESGLVQGSRGAVAHLFEKG